MQKQFLAKFVVVAALMFPVSSFGQGGGGGGGGSSGGGSAGGAAVRAAAAWTALMACPTRYVGRAAQRVDPSGPAQVRRRLITVSRPDSAVGLHNRLPEQRS